MRVLVPVCPVIYAHGVHVTLNCLLNVSTNMAANNKMQMSLNHYDSMIANNGPADANSLQ